MRGVGLCAAIEQELEQVLDSGRVVWRLLAIFLATGLVATIVDVSKIPP